MYLPNLTGGQTDSHIVILGHVGGILFLTTNQNSVHAAPTASPGRGWKARWVSTWPWRRRSIAGAL